MDTLALIFTLLLLIPYIAWGVYTLTLRYRYHEEAGIITEAITLLCVVLFMAVQISLMRTWMVNTPLLYVFTLLSLMVSVAALYGHVAISFTSRLIVEAVSGGDDGARYGPAMGPVEALERQADYEGALQECYVIARIYPHDPAVHLHAADNLLHLKRPEEAAEALERALKYVTVPEKNLMVMNRLCEVCLRDLASPERAIAAMQHYLDRFPATSYATSLHQRMEQASSGHEAHVSAELSRLDESSLEEDIVEPEEAPREHADISLVALDADPMSLEEDADSAGPEAPSQSVPQRARLSALQEAPIDEEEEDMPTVSPAFSGGIEALDDAPLTEENEASPDQPGARKKFELESMEEDTK